MILKKLLIFAAPNDKWDTEIWCNGSTRDSGSLGSGSSPDLSTTRKNFVFLIKSTTFALPFREKFIKVLKVK